MDQSNVACSLAALPWLRGIPADAFFPHEAPADGALDSSNASRERTREAEADAEVDSATGNYLFRKYVEEVRVSFSVMDREGRPVFDVQPKDLQLFENMIPVQQITAFDHNEETPKRMAVLLDNSGSIKQLMAPVKTSLMEVLSGVVRPGRDEAMIATLDGTKVRWLTQFTDSVPQLRSAIATVTPEGPTALYDSLVQMTADSHWRSADRARAQRVILLFTDGEDNLSFHSLRETIEAVTESSYYVYAVAVRSRRSTPKGLRALREITKATGGRVFEMRNPQDLRRAIQSINDDMKAQYSIAYRRPNNDTRAGYREISIIPSDNNWVVRSRAGYLAAPRD